MINFKSKIVERLDSLPEIILEQILDFIELSSACEISNVQLKQKKVFGKSLSEEEDFSLFDTESKLYKVGTALVVESIPSDNLGACVEQMREERIDSIIADYARH